MITAIADHSGLTKVDAGRALSGLSRHIEKTLKKGESVALVGFGTFDVKARATRKGRNPQTSKEIKLKRQMCRPSKPVKV